MLNAVQRLRAGGKRLAERRASRQDGAMKELSLAVVGIDYPNKGGGSRRFELLQCDPGEPVALRPEPRNRHDPNAVGVWSARGVQIGYLSAERAPWIGRRVIEEEAQAVFQAIAGPVAYIRVRFGGGAPTLPVARAAADAEDAFAPDPEGSIWGA